MNIKYASYVLYEKGKLHSLLCASFDFDDLNEIDQRVCFNIKKLSPSDYTIINTIVIDVFAGLDKSDFIKLFSKKNYKSTWYFEAEDVFETKEEAVKLLFKEIF